MKLGEIVSFKTLSGEKVIVGDTTVTPQSRTLAIRLPFAAFVWNRPVAVLVERSGSTERVVISNVTGDTRRKLTGFILGLFILTLIVSARRRRNNNS